MAERYWIALSYGASWLVLGWGTFAVVRLMRKRKGFLGKESDGKKRE
jgi:hypothetical protein